MLHCREVATLVSESIERELPLRQRLQVWMHLAMCRLCAGFARQLRLVRQAVRENAERLAGPAGPQATLSPEARKRIRAAIREGRI